MSRATVEQVIGRFGSQQRVAELLGIWQTAVSGWVRRGAIPAKRQEQLLRIAQREGVSLAPADFFADPRPWSANGQSSARALAGVNPYSEGAAVNDGAKVIPLTGQPAAAPGRARARPGRQGPLRDRRDPAARPRAPQHVRLGDPARAPRRAHGRDAAGGGADAGARQPRGPGPGDGRRRQLQRHLGRARQAGLGVRRAQGRLPRRRLGRRGRGLGGRRQGQPLEGRRPGGGPLQPGRRRGRGVQRRRPDVLALAADLGLRDARRLVRPVLPRPGAPADAAPAPSHLGGERLLRADAGHRLPHAVRPSAPRPAPRR